MSLFTVDRRQAGILADRYLDVILGDFFQMFLLLLLAPAIGGLIAGVWSNVSSDSLTLYFVIALSAFFIGTICSVREVVKERDLFLRERMFNLSVGSYVVSKLRVQAILMVVESVLLVGVVQFYIPLKVNVFWVAGITFLTALTGTAVGLAVSAWVKSADKAMLTVPLLVIPQILFSDFVLTAELKNWTGFVKDVMPVQWAYSFLEEMRGSNTDLTTILAAPAVLLVIIFLSYLLTIILLSRAEY